jgi:hypothetical protein
MRRGGMMETTSLGVGRGVCKIVLFGKSLNSPKLLKYLIVGRHAK